MIFYLVPTVSLRFVVSELPLVLLICYSAIILQNQISGKNKRTTC